MRSDSVWQYIWDNGTIPHTFEMDGKNYLLDSYMRNKILDTFGPAIAEEIRRTGKERYHEEMLRLSEAAGIDLETYFDKARPKGYRPLSEAFISSRAQEMIVKEAKFARFNPTKKGL